MPAIFLLFVVLAAEHVEATQTCTRKMDLLIGVDGSSIMCSGAEPCEKWNAILQLCKDIVNSLTIGKNDTRVAFVTAADKIKMEWNFNEYPDKNALVSAIGRVAYKEGDMSDLLSSLTLFTDIFNLGSGDRLDVPNVAIAVTDGLPLIDLVDAATVSNAVQKIGATVILVCVAPGCTESFARGVSSEPKKANETYFLLDDHLSINKIRNQLVKQICSYGQTKLL